MNNEVVLELDKKRAAKLAALAKASGLSRIEFAQRTAVSVLKLDYKPAAVKPRVLN